VLGGLLIDPTGLGPGRRRVVADDFYRPDHQLIFNALAELAASGKPGDVVTVSEQLQRNGKLEQAGGLAYLGTWRAIRPPPPTCAPMRRSCASARCCAN
jgi:replicative DNA helicase